MDIDAMQIRLSRLEKRVDAQDALLKAMNTPAEPPPVSDENDDGHEAEVAEEVVEVKDPPDHVQTA